MRTHNL